jgi:CheY-like chemotaxis protein
MLAHELRNPIGAIANGIFVLQQHGATEEARQRALGVLDRQVRRQVRMVDDLLDVSRITRGLIELRDEPLDLAPLLRESIEEQSSAFEGQGVALEFELTGAPLPIRGDRDRLAQVLGNLLNNALKFTPQGGRLVVSVERRDEEIEVRVRDTRIGIPADLFPHVFESFTQGDRSLARSRGGLGLGLALVRGLVQLHRGSVSAASDGPGHGAEFVVRLPIPRCGNGIRTTKTRSHGEERNWAEIEGRTQNRVAHASPVVNPNFHSVSRHLEGNRLRGATPETRDLRVLVIEDNRDGAESLRDVLELAGWTVELAHAGPAGIEAARRMRPDVILCDIGLPGMDGYQVASALRRDPVTCSTRLIAISGYGSDGDRERSLQAGFDFHVVKPVASGILCWLMTAPKDR